MPANWPSYRRFAGYAAIAVTTACAPFLLWKLADILLLAFGGALIASLLHLVATPIRRVTRLPVPICLALSGLLVAAVVVGTLWVSGSHILDELSDTVRQAASEIDALHDRFEHRAIGRFLLARADKDNISIAAYAERFVTLGSATLEAISLVVITAVFLAANPRPYRDGALLLFPRDQRVRIADAAAAVAASMRYWLLGQFISMAYIGFAVGIATWLVGLRTPVALGLIAALAEFVPYIGAVLGFLPALLVALSMSSHAAPWTIAAFAAIHLVEANLLAPLVQRWAVSVPPAMLLVGIAAASTLFGIFGLVFAAPLTVVTITAVKALYVRDALGESVTLPTARDRLSEEPPSGP